MVDAISGLTAYDQGGMDTTATVQSGDTLASISQRIYGNSSLWYVLASANAIADSAPTCCDSRQAGAGGWQQPTLPGSPNF